jgi:hypothetical protein
MTNDQGHNDRVSVSSHTESFIEKLWNTALCDSTFPGSSVHLLPVPGAGVTGHNKAACYPPYIELVDEPSDLLHDAMLAEANLPEHRGKHRVAIYEDVDPEDATATATMAGVLRHELRHAEQREACGGVLFALDELADQIISWKMGGLPNTASLYRLKPVEVDANAASALFLRKHYADQVEAILDNDDGPLARSHTPPGSLHDLPAKTVAFMFGFCEVAEDPTRSADWMDFRARLDRIGPQCGRLWDALTAGRQP